MPNDAQIALKKKLQLEADLRPKLERFNDQTVREFTRALGMSGAIPQNERERTAELAPILLAHYDQAGAAFDSELRDDMPPDLAMTPAESAEVASVLAAFFAQRGPEQSLAINETTSDQFIEAERDAREIQRKMAEDGEIITHLELATLAGASLGRKLAGRVGGIAALETQAPAEASKLTEASVLAGLGAAALLGPGRALAPSDVTKEWDTVGDSLVRDAHVQADSIQVPLNTPYTVMGEKLRYPGDTSLGATMANVANCRCSSSTNVESVISARQDLPRFVEAPASL